MNVVKSFSRRSFLWTMFFMFLFTGIFNAAGYYAWQTFVTVLPLNLIKETASNSVEFNTGVQSLLPLVSFLKTFFLPVMLSFFILSGLILWGIHRKVLSNLIKKSGISISDIEQSKEKDKSEIIQKKSGETDRKNAVEQNKRLYLYILNILQREGRLIDFFAEDLSNFEDSQIGMAVRSIHENCKKSLKKHINPKPVIDKSEGDQIPVNAGFDPYEIKLTGNVSGEPPFHGILRHKGWRASKIDLPTLSPGQDPGIIAPAEVEIL